MRILYLSKRWKHHTASGGYDRLVTEVGAEEVRRRLLPKVLSKGLQVTRKFLSMNPPYLLDYRYEDLCAERELLSTARQTHPDVAHVLYGDEQLDLLLRTEQPLTCPLVVTFHLPTARARARLDSIDKKSLARINAVIVLASFQVEDYRAWFRADQLFYVPHGIDTVRFQPNPARADGAEIRLVTVGTHMRDWDAIERIIQNFAQRNLPVCFSVVDSYGRCRFLKKYHNVDLLSSLSEDDLVKLYQGAEALLLPVTSSTANNSALESLACGTPVISTAIEGMPDYVDAASGWLFPKGEVDGIVQLIEQAVERRSVFSSLREGARQKALDFGWEKIASQMKQIYKQVVAVAVSR